MNNNTTKAKQVAFLGLMLALIFVLTYIEHLLPPIPFFPPNVKLGLSNIVTMFCVYYIGYKEAFLLAFLKSMFVFLTRGMTAGILSFSGGVLSILTLIIILFLSKNKASYLLLSIFSAIMHNMGQTAAVSILMGSMVFIYYIPILIISGVVMGIITGLILRGVLPALKKLI